MARIGLFFNISLVLTESFWPAREKDLHKVPKLLGVDKYNKSGLDPGYGKKPKPWQPYPPT